jgi:hypothetical protein
MRQIAAALRSCHLPDHERTALYLLANQRELGQSLLLGTLPRGLHHITSYNPGGTSVVSFAGAVTDDRREIRYVGGENLTSGGATRTSHGSTPFTRS